MAERLPEAIPHSSCYKVGGIVGFRHTSCDVGARDSGACLPQLKSRRAAAIELIPLSDSVRPRNFGVP